jgi:hypothetical protein
MMPGVLILAVVVGALVTGEPSAAIQPDQIDQASQQVLDDDYQAELPRGGSDTASSGDPSGDDDDSPHFRPRMRPRGGGGRLVPVDGDRRGGERGDEMGTGAPSALFQYLMWAFVFVAVAVLAFWLARELAGYTGDAEIGDDQTGEPNQPDRAVVERPLGDADELARQGLYAEAIHTLLLRTLQELVRSAQVRVAPANTSREILARVPLLGDARTALAGLITAVEVTHFGDAEPSADDYGRCRQQFNVFATAFRAGGRAA